MYFYVMFYSVASDGNGCLNNMLYFVSHAQNFYFYLL